MHGSDWKRFPVFMMDFEGGPASGVVEFGVVRLEGGSVGETMGSLCRPSGPISGLDQRVHGISEARASTERPFAEVYDRFVEFRRQGVFAAHNRHAENGFLKATWALPPRVPDWRRGDGLAQEWGPWIDTLSIYRTVYPGLESYALGELVRLFQQEESLERIAEEHCPADRRHPHCALYDALASALLLLRLEQEEELAGRVTLGWLLELSEGTKPQIELF